MIDSIVKRRSKLQPFTETQIKIVRSAAKLFLANGFTKTTLRQIEKDCDVAVGNILYHFHTKESLLDILIEELMDFHGALVEDMQGKTGDKLLSWAVEIAVQMALCENNRNAWDLYHSAYILPVVYENIKTWAVEKNYNIFRDRLPDWTEHDFKDIEQITSGLELAALQSICTRSYTLDKKVSVFLNAIMLHYAVSEDERKKVIEKVLALDYEEMAKNMFDNFVKRLDNTEEGL